jgi:hypothetical protein
MTTTAYPAKTCELDRLVTQPKLIALAINGDKTQQRRNGIYGYPGERFKLDGIDFEITNVSRQTLGEMTEADAKAEGFDSLNEYQQLILRMHQGMQWQPDAKVWLHQFHRVD